MAITQTLVLYSLLFVVYISNNVEAQVLEKTDLTFKTLEGVPVKVRIELDYVDDKIEIILSPSQTICLNGFRDLVGDVAIINKKFMTLHYKMRSGSGVKEQRSVFICVSRGQLYKAMDISSMNSYEFKDTYNAETDSLGLYDERGIYQISFINSQNVQNDEYKLTALQYEKVESKLEPNKSYEILDSLWFRFDIKNKVFYTEYKTLRGNFLLEGAVKKTINFKGKKYPLIKLKREEYFFINKTWYIKVRGNHFSEVLPACN